MKVALFRSRAEPGLCAYTLDETGGNLPDELGPWKQIRIVTVTGPGLPEGESRKAIGTFVVQALQEEGFCCICSRSASERLRLNSVVSFINDSAPSEERSPGQTGDGQARYHDPQKFGSMNSGDN